MRRHLNTLYVTPASAWLRKDGENVVVEVDGEERGRVPVHLLGGIVCFGAVGMTPALMGHCAARGVCVSMLSRSGRFLARVEGVNAHRNVRNSGHVSGDWSVRSVNRMFKKSKACGACGRRLRRPKRCGKRAWLDGTSSRRRCTRVFHAAGRVHRPSESR